MLLKRNIFILGCALQVSFVLSLSRCTEDTECLSLQGSVCRDGDCVCPSGQQPVYGGTLCDDAAPYYTSLCVEDHQCSNLVTGFVCRKDSPDSPEGNCYCQTGFHYFRGRCWRSVDYGESCNRNEECLGVIQDPFSLACNGVCVCAEGYYQRQRAECRKIGRAVGDGCVLNEDCQFQDGACDINTFRCYNISAAIIARDESNEAGNSTLVTKTLVRQHGVECDSSNVCAEPYICSTLGACVCPSGYYASDDGTRCLAQLGSPATSDDDCVGLFAEVRDAVCTCQANFFFEENMRDCTKVTRQITDSCLTDNSCHTFGATARCGEPGQWYLRNCECTPELSVWDANRQLCRLFAGIGEFCEVDSDCIAGEMEIECSYNDFNEGYCVCPESFVAVDGLCLTSGLQLNDTCQASQECSGTDNTVCVNGRCSCDDGYQEIDNYCAPTIGGTCEVNNNCTIENTVCVTIGNYSTCQCDDNFVAYSESCWPMVIGYESFCNVSAQCIASLGPQSTCNENHCICIDSTHHRDGGCWNSIGIFEGCSRTSECYLQGMSERVECRNSLCQCTFDYPYSEELHICTSGAAKMLSHIILILSALLFAMYN